MKSIRFIVFISFQLMVLTLMAQGVPLYQSGEVEIDSKNVYASKNPRVAEKDKKGYDVMCGLVLVKSTLSNLSFPQAVGNVEYRDSKYYVYLKPKTKKVKVECGKYKINLKVDGGVDPKVTYTTTVVQKEVFGSFSLKAKPVNVNVYLDGKSLGRTPLNNYKLYPGEYRLILTSPGYVDEELYIDIQPNSNKSYDAELLSAPDYGALYRQYKKY